MTELCRFGVTSVLFFGLTAWPLDALSQIRDSLVVDPPGAIARMLDLEKPPTVSVVLIDQATDGCWTNLGEAREYATDTLQNIGLRVGDETGLIFSVGVFSGRTNSRHCYGYMKVSLDAHLQNGFARSIINRTLIFTGENSANVMTLDIIGEVGRGMLADLR